MTPAQRRKKRAKRRAKKRKNSPSLIKPLVFIGVLLLGLLYIHFTNFFWDKESKLSMAVVDKKGDVFVTTFDPNTNSITTINIPGETQVRVARQLGTWRLKSVWELGEDEGLSGRLLTETVTRHFNMPVFVWAEGGALGFSAGESTGVFGAIFAPYGTNLGFGDKVRLGLFSLGVKNFKKEEINLVNTRYLDKKVLVDGEEGYVVEGSIPNSISAVFSEPKLSNLSAKLKIIDATGKKGIAEDLGEIIEVLGLKVASISQEDEEHIDCLVSGKNDEVIQKISYLFLCEKKDLNEENFELVVKIGKNFAKRF